MNYRSDNMDYSTADKTKIMKKPASPIEGLNGQMLQFQYEEGSITLVQSGAVAQWRTLPFASMAHISGGIWKIEREDRSPYLVHSDQACCIPAGIRHRSFMLSEGVSDSRWAHFNILLCGYIDLLSLVDLPEVFTGDVAQRLRDILQQLAQLQTETNPILLLLNRKVLEFELAAILIRESKPKYQSHLRLQQLQRVLPALNAIDKNLAAAFTREKLASLCHLSASRFAAIFKEALGISPIDYILKLRMQRAQQLLTGADFSIEQIASQIGYDDAFYFSRLFKTHYGLSPKKYQTEATKASLN